MLCEGELSHFRYYDAYSSCAALASACRPGLLLLSHAHFAAKLTIHLQDTNSACTVCKRSQKLAQPRPLTVWRRNRTAICYLGISVSYMLLQTGLHAHEGGMMQKHTLLST